MPRIIQMRLLTAFVALSLMACGLALALQDDTQQ
jgi:hypothetical protein